MVYVKTKNGKHTVDFFAVIYKDKKGNDVTDVYVDNYHMHTLRVYYRHERTWDDHMGNTPCGYYCNVPIAGKKHRIYYEQNAHYEFD